MDLDKPIYRYQLVDAGGWERGKGRSIEDALEWLCMFRKGKCMGWMVWDSWLKVYVASIIS